MQTTETETLTGLPSKTLRRAANIKEKIERAEAELGKVLRVTINVGPTAPTPEQQSKFSHATRLRLSRIARKRWAKVKANGKSAL